MLFIELFNCLNIPANQTSDVAGGGVGGRGRPGGSRVEGAPKGAAKLIFKVNDLLPSTSFKLLSRLLGNQV